MTPTPESLIGPAAAKALAEREQAWKDAMEWAAENFDRYNQGPTFESYRFYRDGLAALRELA